MPKIVDHDERRRSVIEATWRVIAREGIASATTRGIAREAGCSSGVLAHYFADKAELMASAMLAAHAEVHARLDTRLTGLASVRQYMLECLPLDERRRFLAVVEVSFWGQAVGNGRLVDLYADEVEGFRGKLRVRLAQAREQGELGPGVDVEVGGDEVLEGSVEVRQAGVHDDGRDRVDLRGRALGRAPPPS